ncbi:DUF4181 domain-containing protein [Tetzosporium hominis]|nr:DUF4181 domain-containing protein [Tetzosporium hominis]
MDNYWYPFLMGFLAIGAIFLLQWGVYRYFQVPMRQSNKYYTKSHRYLHYGLLAAFVIGSISINFAIANQDTEPALGLFLFPPVFIGIDELLKIGMQWKYAEHRGLYKANLIHLLGAVGILALMILVFINYFEVPFL